MKLPYYNNLTNKDKFFNSAIINNMQDFDNFIFNSGKLKVNKNIIFRGVNEAKFKLYNSAQRYWITNELSNFNGESYIYFISNLIENIKNSKNGLLDKYFKSFGYTPNDFSILSFLQHYKAPTPLLDWTKQFNYSLFFATDNLEFSEGSDIDNYFSIYAVDTTILKERKRVLKDSIMEIIPTIENVLSTSYIRNARSTIEGLNRIEYALYVGSDLLLIDGFDLDSPIYKSEKLSNLIIHFYQANLNVIAQDGCFIHSHSEDKPLEDYFSNEQPKNNLFLPKICCWNIHKHLKNYVIEYLNKPENSVTKELLYPQEENIAKLALEGYLNQKPSKFRHE